MAVDKSRKLILEAEKSLRLCSKNLNNIDPKIGEEICDVVSNLIIILNATVDVLERIISPSKDKNELKKLVSSIQDELIKGRKSLNNKNDLNSRKKIPDSDFENIIAAIESLNYSIYNLTDFIDKIIGNLVFNTFPIDLNEKIINLAVSEIRDRWLMEASRKMSEVSRKTDINLFNSISPLSYVVRDLMYASIELTKG
ncbi:MAG TPA: hypothetical protein VJI68_00240 [Candidatus Nanoarchaeia archaeon]|nr:hypothetical protein [Candidatus Nanoarchaeia archaeon]